MQTLWHNTDMMVKADTYEWNVERKIKGKKMKKGCVCMGGGGPVGPKCNMYVNIKTRDTSSRIEADGDQ